MSLVERIMQRDQKPSLGKRFINMVKKIASIKMPSRLSLARNLLEMNRNFRSTAPIDWSAKEWVQGIKSSAKLRETLREQSELLRLETGTPEQQQQAADHYKKLKDRSSYR